MRSMPTGSVDLVFTSPPYEDARTYGIDYTLRGREYVDWCVERYLECLRVSRGLVAWVIEGRTRNFQWSATPVLLMAALHERGVKLRKPPAFHRAGIPGSGGPDWLRNDYEFIVCASHGKLSWSENTACGHAPKWAPGGNPTHRTKSGRRVHKLHTKADAVSKKEQGYNPPALANPGNVIECDVGGGRMGHPLAHENEAPFPLTLAEFFIKSFCPPGGTVLDPFAGSGTTAHAALVHGRNSVSFDIRESQCNLIRKRLESLA